MRKYFAILVFAMIFNSCKTYTVTPENLKEQLSATNGLKKAEINNPLSYGSLTYEANQLKKIRVTNKDGRQESLENSPALEMRVTLKNKKRYKFYFDTVVIQNDTLSGGRSRFISGLTRKIPFDSIQKIEIQDGGKKFEYQ
jgi:hypothetical protein